jgi:hypothetical protein
LTSDIAPRVSTERTQTPSGGRTMSRRLVLLDAAPWRVAFWTGGEDWFEEEGPDVPGETFDVEEEGGADAD